MNENIFGKKENINETREKIANLVKRIKPFDSIESDHIKDASVWIASGVEIFKIKGPDIPPKHLVSFSVLLDKNEKKILLLDHRKALLMLPSGGHLNKDELPLEAAKRELIEEVGIEPKSIFDDAEIPFFITVTKTVGLTAGHTDVSLWYIFEGDSGLKINDEAEEFKREFAGHQWLSLDEILATPIEKFDVNMHRFVNKLKEHYGDN